jgi:RES domain-containing protein
MLLWRVSKHANLDGRGGLLASARWHSQGSPVVYLATSPAGALLEVLVHLELTPGDFPRSYRLLKAEVSDEVPVPRIEAESLPRGWQFHAAVTRSKGDEWLAALSSALLAVPSALVPETFNVMLNPRHPDAAQVRVLAHRQYGFDPRLFER